MAVREGEEVLTNNMVTNQRNISQLKQAWDGLDFVMEMFDVPRFPRNVSTGATGGRQRTVNSRDEAMTFFEGALYEDCYINAYLTTPDNYYPMTNLRHWNLPLKLVPNHIMIDLDREPFNSDEELETALAETLKNIKASVTGIAAEHYIVIASGSGGYHIHIPLPGLTTPLQDMPEFEAFKEDQELANKFLRFAERRLTNNKADHRHSPSVNSCLFRVPGTINTRARAMGKDPIVRVVQGMEYVMHRITQEHSLPEAWLEAEESRPTTKFLNEFHAYLVQQQINNKISKSDRRLRSLVFGNVGIDKSENNSIWWIDKLLSVGVEDGRKDLMFWVLAPYLVTVAKIDYDKAYQVLEQWLEKCDDVRRLEPDWSYFRYRIRYCLESAESHERLPIKFETFQEYYPDLCCNKELFKE